MATGDPLWWLMERPADRDEGESEDDDPNEIDTEAPSSIFAHEYSCQDRCPIR